MTNDEALKVIKSEAVRLATIAEALNTLYRNAVGVDAIPKDPSGTLRPLPTAAAELGLGSVYRTKNR